MRNIQVITTHINNINGAVDMLKSLAAQLKAIPILKDIYITLEARDIDTLCGNTKEILILNIPLNYNHISNDIVENALIEDHIVRSIYQVLNACFKDNIVKLETKDKILSYA